MRDVQLSEYEKRKRQMKELDKWVFVTAVLVTHVFVTHVLVTHVLVTHVLVTHVLVTRVLNTNFNVFVHDFLSIVFSVFFLWQ